MPRTVFVYDPPERFVAGTVGQPGDRTFFLQARSGSQITSVVLEKAQTELLAEKILELLEEVERRHPEVAELGIRNAIEDNDPLELPIDEEFRVSALGLGWNAATNRVIVEAHGGDSDDVPDLEDDSDETAGPVLRVRITASEARAFASRAQRVVAAGRPPCPFCHLPLDPEGHICPRANGYRR